MVFPGAFEPTGELLEMAKVMRKRALWAHSNGVAVHGTEDADWSVTDGQKDERRFRAHMLQTVNGQRIVLRAIAKEVLPFASLGIHSDLTRYLLDPDFAPNGGLVLISGSMGDGKSTTAASLLVQRVSSLGRFALAVEEPPEFALHDTYRSPDGKNGVIIQVPAARDMLARELRGALRCYPANVRGSMLLVGEVRDSTEAAHVLRASMNGLLVVTTIHAGDVIATLERFHALAAAELGPEMAQSLLGASIRAVLCQKLSRSRLNVTSLVSPTATSPAAAVVARGAFRQLSTEIQRQEAAMKMGGFADLVREMSAPRASERVQR